MKKKSIIICTVVVAVIVAVIVVAVLGLTNMFTKGVITGTLYRVENVYEEIWNLVNSEKNGTQTILTTSIDGSEVIYELGRFQQVSIPVNEEYRIALCFDQNEMQQEELIIWLFERNDEDHDTPLYVYNYQTNTLYGNQEESLLKEQFTSLYDSWVGNDGQFNTEEQGDYTFVLTEFPLSHK